MSSFHDAIKKLLHYTFITHANDTADTSVMGKFVSPGLMMLPLPENKIFIERNSTLDHIYIFVSGIAYVVNYTPDGRRIIADTFTEPQIFGLVEAVSGDSHYKGTVVTLSDSIVFKAKRQEFLDILYSDAELSSMVIKYMASLTLHTMRLSEYRSAKSPYDNLIIYLYNKSLGKKLPYRLKDNKAFIADSLQINKRSLYRYLNQLSAEGVIERQRQDIVITEEHFKRIEQLFSTINEL